MSSSSKARQSSKPMFGGVPMPSRNGKPNSKQNKKKNLKYSPNIFRELAPVSAYTVTARKGQPRISSFIQNGKAVKLVCHDEYITNVAGSVAYTTTAFNVNPGLAATFPWLQFEAIGWERFRFRKLEFYTTTQCATTATGMVAIAPDYDSGDAAPASEQVFMSYVDRVDGPPWKIDPLVCSLKQEAMNLSYKTHFIRFGSLAANEDIQTYDPAIAYVTTVGQAGTTNVSKLHVRYECEFHEPQLPPGGSPIANSGTIVGVTSLTNTTIFGTAPSIVGPIAISVASNVVTISGLITGARYACSTQLAGTVISATAVTVTSGGTQTNNSFIFNAAATLGIGFLDFSTTSSTVVLTFAVTATSILQSDFFISLVNSNGAF